MAQNGPDLTPAQQLAIAALASGQSLTDAAKTAKTSRRTLTRWRSEDEAFQAQLAQAQHLVYSETIGAIVAGSVEAIAALRAIATSEKSPAAARVSAALGILNHAHQNYRSALIEERLNQLEVVLSESE